MSSLTAQVALKIAADFVSTLDVGSATYPVNYSATNNFANGTGADQANQIFTDTRTLSTSATENLDLAGGLTDPFGATITFAKVKAILITAASANTNNVQVTRPASSGLVLFMAASDGIALTPGASFAAVFPNANGVAVTAGTGDLLTLTNSAGSTSVTYTVVIIGTI